MPKKYKNRKISISKILHGKTEYITKIIIAILCKNLIYIIFYPQKQV